MYFSTTNDISITFVYNICYWCFFWAVPTLKYYFGRAWVLLFCEGPSIPTFHVVIGHRNIRVKLYKKNL